MRPASHACLSRPAGWHRHDAHRHRRRVGHGRARRCAASAPGGYAGVAAGRSPVRGIAARGAGGRRHRGLRPRRQCAAAALLRGLRHRGECRGSEPAGAGPRRPCFAGGRRRLCRCRRRRARARTARRHAVRRSAPAALGGNDAGPDGAPAAFSRRRAGRAPAAGRGPPLAAWRGRIATRALEARPDADIEFFPGRVTALPYLSQENTRIARTLGLAAGDWYNVFAGQHLRDAFARVQNLLHASGEAAAIEALCTSAALDLAGRAPYQLLVCRVESASASRSLMLRASDSYALTGAMAAFAALALCEGEVPPGVHFAGEVMAPDRTVTRLRSSSAVTAIDLVDGGAVDEPAFEQGAL